MGISKILKNVDLYGKQFNFTVQGSEKFKSKSGGCLTLVLITGLLTYGILFGVGLMFEPYTWDIVTYERLLKSD